MNRNLLLLDARPVFAGGSDRPTPTVLMVAVCGVRGPLEVEVVRAVRGRIVIPCIQRWHLEKKCRTFFTSFDFLPSPSFHRHFPTSTNKVSQGQRSSIQMQFFYKLELELLVSAEVSSLLLGI